jgi:ribosomal protein L11
MDIDTDLKVKHKVTMAIRCQSAESGPPIGTILGNLGVSSIKFCQQFNEVTSDLPNYFVVLTIIEILENNSFNFYIKAPTIGYIISLLRQARRLAVEEDDDLWYDCIRLSDVIKLALFKFPDYPIDRAIKVVFGCVYSSNLYVIYDNEESEDYD